MLCAWRGRSGCRYVVAIYCRARLTDELDRAPDALSQVVVLAVRNDPASGTASIVAASEGLDHCGATNWLASLARVGVDEFHLHRLAQSSPARQAILVDLSGSDREVTR